MAANILVVDDEPQLERLIRQRFRKQVREDLYAFQFAKNGQEALDLVESTTEIDMILTDINMPIMDGLTLINKLNPKYPILKIVIISAYGDMNNIRKAMNYGAFDFLTKPIDFGDLEKTIEKTLGEIELLRDAKRSKELAEKNKHLKEIDQLKSTFFTNISHEFRTPLTIIMGMTDQIRELPEKWREPGIEMIRRNANSLLHLINQILDLRKLEAHSMQLNPESGDFMILAGYLAKSFQALAEARDIRFHYQTKIEYLPVRFDSEKMYQVLSNLLANALKFTPAGGNIFFNIEEDQNQLLLSIRDTGRGIARSHLPHIFDRFYQGSGNGELGTGIGLSLVKEITNLMDGQISVDSEVNAGTLFSLQLPVTRLNMESIPATPLRFFSRDTVDPLFGVSTYHQEEESFLNPADFDLPSVLIVEDNTEVCRYLTIALEGRYFLRTAENGELGLQAAIQFIPDLIISDVMMPKMDGLALCKAIKSDARTDHIPIILLTAKADLESKISGLETGADDYLAKPVEKRELIARLENLLEVRSKLRQRYLQGNPDRQDLRLERPEDQFVMKLKEIVHRNLSDDEFGIYELCQSMVMSRTQLHRKIKAITGTSTSIFVRYIRLDAAKKLLENTGKNVSEVAYEVGFSDPKYFSRVFIERFGSPPIKFKRP
ncbi:MAG: response regulator [Saprospiraceae bacterium]|nr:response regulator [Saprospiraceae bacterium]